jgi:hypothetical protein
MKNLAGSNPAMRAGFFFTAVALKLIGLRNTEVTDIFAVLPNMIKSNF